MTLFPSLCHLLVYLTNQSSNKIMPLRFYSFTHRTKESVSRSHKFWQCRQGLDCYILGHFSRGMDRDNVLCPRCSLFLGLDLFRPTHCGQYLVSQESLSFRWQVDWRQHDVWFMRSITLYAKQENTLESSAACVSSLAVIFILPWDKATTILSSGETSLLSWVLPPVRHLLFSQESLSSLFSVYLKDPYPWSNSQSHLLLPLIWSLFHIHLVFLFVFLFTSCPSLSLLSSFILPVVGSLPGDMFPSFSISFLLWLLQLTTIEVRGKEREEKREERCVFNRVSFGVTHSLLLS